MGPERRAAQRVAGTVALAVRCAPALADVDRDESRFPHRLATGSVALAA